MADWPSAGREGDSAGAAAHVGTWSVCLTKEVEVRGDHVNRMELRPPAEARPCREISEGGHGLGGLQLLEADGKPVSGPGVFGRRQDTVLGSVARTVRSRNPVADPRRRNGCARHFGSRAPVAGISRGRRPGPTRKPDRTGAGRPVDERRSDRPSQREGTGHRPQPEARATTGQERSRKGDRGREIDSRTGEAVPRPGQASREGEPRRLPERWKPGPRRTGRLNWQG